MRLIDADNLKIHLLYDDSWDLEYPTYGVFDYEIQEEPTVNAIPIEWIKNWVANIKNNPRYKNEYIEDLGEISKIVYRHGMVVLPIPCVSDMLKDWEE